MDAQISFASSSGKRKTSSSIIGRVGYRPAIGPVPIIIDQSCLDGKPLPHPLDNPNYPIPKTLRKAVDDLKAVLEHEGEARKNASWRSSASPSYILVHENILPLFQRAIETSGVSSLAQFEFQSIANAQAILEALPSPTALQYIPIFTCTSLDRAIDFVNNEAPKPTVSFIFASPSFSAYAANQLEGDDVVIGGIPESIIGGSRTCQAR